MATCLYKTLPIFLKKIPFALSLCSVSSVKPFLHVYKRLTNVYCRINRNFLVRLNVECCIVSTKIGKKVSGFLPLA